MTTSLMVHDFMISLNNIINMKSSDKKKENLESKINETFENFALELKNCHYSTEKSNNIFKEALSYKNELTASLDKILSNLDKDSIPKGFNKV